MAGAGEIPEPTVIVWMEETQFLCISLRLLARVLNKCGRFYCLKMRLMTRKVTSMNKLAGEITSDKKKSNTRAIAIIAVFTAISATLSYIEIPLMPAAPWLKYDPSGVISLVVSLVFGPISGALVAILSWIPRLLTNPIGATMNIVAAISMVIPAGYLYQRSKTIGSAVSGMALGICCSVTVSIVLNFIATPLYYGGTPADVLKMILPVLIPFNLIKLFINCGITLLVYKTVSNMVHKRKLT